MQSHDIVEERDRYDLVLSGMGPVGLVAAFFATKFENQHRLLILDKRAENKVALRPQVVLLERACRLGLLTNMIDESHELSDRDIKFLDGLSRSSEVKISALQKFIMGRLAEVNKDYKKAHPDQEQPLIEFVFEEKLETVDLSCGKAALREANGNKRNITFQHLLAADGANAETLDLVNEGLMELNNNDKTIHRKMPHKLKHVSDTYHLGMSVHVNRKDGMPILLPEREFILSYLNNKNNNLLSSLFDTPLLYFLRIDKKSHEKSTGKIVKIGFVGEIPKELYDNYQEIKLHEERLKRLLANKSDYEENDNQEKAIRETIDVLKQVAQDIAKKYVRKAIVHYFTSHNVELSEDEIELTITSSKTSPAKDNLKSGVFKGKSLKADKAITELNGHSFGLIGDSYFIPLYPTGRGFNDGYALAYLLFKLPKLLNFENENEYMDQLKRYMQEYNTLADQRSNNAISDMGRYYWLSWYKYLGLKKPDEVLEEIEQAVAKAGENNANEIYNTENVKNAIINYLKKKFSLSDIKDGILNDKIEEWKKFLLDNSSLAKIFSAEIYSYLKEIRELVRRDNNIDIQIRYKLNHLCNQVLLMKTNSNNLQASLIEAIELHDYKTIKSVLKMGADPSTIDSLVLFTPKISKNPPLVQLLIKYGANPFYTTKTETVVTFSGESFPYSPFVYSLKPFNLLNEPLGLQLILALHDKQEPLYTQAISTLNIKLLNAMINELWRVNISWECELENKDNKNHAYFEKVLERVLQNSKEPNKSIQLILCDYTIEILNELKSKLVEKDNLGEKTTKEPPSHYTPKTTLFSKSKEHSKQPTDTRYLKNMPKKSY